MKRPSTMAMPLLYCPDTPKTPKTPTTPAASAFTQGVIDTIYSSLGALAGSGDGKVYHHYAPGSREEFNWDLGCQWTAEKLMQGAMMKEALRQGDKE